MVLTSYDVHIPLIFSRLLTSRTDDVLLIHIHFSCLRTVKLKEIVHLQKNVLHIDSKQILYLKYEQKKKHLPTHLLSWNHSFL